MVVTVQISVIHGAIHGLQDIDGLSHAALLTELIVLFLTGGLILKLIIEECQQMSIVALVLHVVRKDV